MSLRNNQTGFSAVELVLVLAVVTLLGFAGYSVYNRQQTKTTGTDSSQDAGTQPATASDVASAPAVSSTSDLDKASATLDQNDPGGSNNTDAGQLDTQVANF